MKRFVAIGMLFAALGAQALTLVAPENGAEVPLLTEKQRAFMKMSFEERRLFFDDNHKNKEKEICRFGCKPLPVRLVWKDPAESVQVRVAKKGVVKPFFCANVSSNCVDVWNLEVGVEYEWSVKAGGETETARFRTEDLAPRLIFVGGDKEHRGVPNMRDMGGRRTMNGRRVRQGLVFRSAGLNNNAPVVYYKLDEILALEKEGKLAGMGDLGASYSRKIRRGAKLEKNYLRLIKSEPTTPGTPRLTEEWRMFLTQTLGIRTDIDLRSDRERFGMTASPLGPDVKFVHDWENYNGYSSVHTTGLAATKTIFRLMMDRGNYPIDFHCIGGADRTGTVATLLHGILGASDEDIWRDYQITGWIGGVNDARHFKWFGDFVKSFDRFRGATLSERICDFFRTSCGFTDADLDRIRAIMLDDATKTERPTARPGRPSLDSRICSVSVDGRL